MSDEIQSLAEVDAGGIRVGVIRSRVNDAVTAGLTDGAVDYLESVGAVVDLFEAPGAFELPLLAARVLDAGCDAAVALGAVIEGETDHYDHVAHRASEGLMRVMLDTGKPVAFGILTVRKEEHALERSRPGPGNKGAEAASAAVEAVLTSRAIAATRS
jgi:6,7-dimethyl-8-ribityllumazine synthase